MKKFFAVLLVLSLLLTPMLCSAEANAAHITDVVYEDGYLIGTVDFQGSGPFWARITFFLQGGTYLLLAAPVYADGTFEAYIGGAVECIAIQIKDTRNLMPGMGTVFDTLMI